MRRCERPSRSVSYHCQRLPRFPAPAGRSQPLCCALAACSAPPRPAPRRPAFHCLQVPDCEGVVLEKCCPLPVKVMAEGDYGATDGTAYSGAGATGGSSYGTTGAADTTSGSYGATGGSSSSTYGGDGSSSSYGKAMGGKMMKKKKGKPVVIVKPLVCVVSWG